MYTLDAFSDLLEVDIAALSSAELAHTLDVVNAQAARASDAELVGAVPPRPPSSLLPPSVSVPFAPLTADDEEGDATTPVMLAGAAAGLAGDGGGSAEVRQWMRDSGMRLAGMRLGNETRHSGMSLAGMRLGNETRLDGRVSCRVVHGTVTTTPERRRGHAAIYIYILARHIPNDADISRYCRRPLWSPCDRCCSTAHFPAPPRMRTRGARRPASTRCTRCAPRSIRDDVLHKDGPPFTTRE